MHFCPVWYIWRQICSYYVKSWWLRPHIDQICPEMYANEIYTLHKVFPSPNPHRTASNSVKHEDIWKLQLIVCNMKYPSSHVCAFLDISDIDCSIPVLTCQFRCHIFGGLACTCKVHCFALCHAKSLLIWLNHFTLQWTIHSVIEQFNIRWSYLLFSWMSCLRTQSIARLLHYLSLR